MAGGGVRSVGGVSETSMRRRGDIWQHGHAEGMGLPSQVGKHPAPWSCLWKLGFGSHPVSPAGAIPGWGVRSIFSRPVSKAPRRCWGFLPSFNASVGFTAGKFLLTPDLCFPLLFQLLLPPPAPVPVSHE